MCRRRLAGIPTLMKTITILCNAALLAAVDSKDIKPIAVSKPVWNGWDDSDIGELLFAAEFEEEKLNSLTEAECDLTHAWWRAFNRSSVDWDQNPWQPRLARSRGIFHWITEKFELSQPRNIAAILGDIAAFENKTPIELFNSLPFSHE